MYEWINTRQCLVYINNLSSFEDPKKILRVVWFTCKELNRFIEEVNFDEEELTKLKDDRFKLMDKIRGFRKNIREINTSMNSTRNLIQLMDDELKSMLENETNEIISSNISLFEDWWKENIETTFDDRTVISTDLWTNFKQENKVIMREMDISGDKFKQYIKSKIPISNIILRSKNVNCAFEIKGIKLKNIVKEVLTNNMNENIIMNLDLEPIENPKAKKIVKPKLKKDNLDES